LDKTKLLEQEKIPKLILRYSIPAIAGMLVNAVYNIVDRIFIGNSDIGKLGIAGITIAFPIMMIIMGIIFLLSHGGSILFSMRLGEKKKDEASKVLATVCIVLLTAGSIIAILGIIFIDPLLKLFGSSNDVLPYARDYLFIIFLGVPFQCVGVGLNNFIRADGFPKTAMITMFIGGIINIILDPVFIYLFGMGMKGAALATIIGQAVSGIWVLLHFTGKKCTVKLNVKSSNQNISIIPIVISYGIPSFIVQVAGSLMNVVLNNRLGLYGGDIAVAGMGTVNSLASLLIMPVIGLVQGVQPIISYNFGAERHDRVRKALFIAIISSTSIVTIGFILVQLFPTQLVSMFGKEPDLVAFGSRALKKWFLCLPFVGFQITGSNFFQAIGRPRISIFLTMTRQILFLIPSILILSSIFGLDGIVYSGAISDFLASFTTGICLLSALKTYGKSEVKTKS